jgi:hypothetical protein
MHKLFRCERTQITSEVYGELRSARLSIFLKVGKSRAGVLAGLFLGRREFLQRHGQALRAIEESQSASEWLTRLLTIDSER